MLVGFGHEMGGERASDKAEPDREARRNRRPEQRSGWPLDLLLPLLEDVVVDLDRAEAGAGFGLVLGHPRYSSVLVVSTGRSGSLRSNQCQGSGRRSGAAPSPRALMVGSSPRKALIRGSRPSGPSRKWDTR